MRVVLALDSFKGSVSARDACAAVARGLDRAVPGVHVVQRPMADGGEGTAATVQVAGGGEWVQVDAAGPLPPGRVGAGYVRLQAGAVVEMARASGLDLLDPSQLNPLLTTTFGTGELLAHAFARGPERVWLAIGGSATVDAGVGAAQALGWRFLDGAGRELGRGGQVLEAVRRIEPPAPDWSPPCPVDVLCDVDNPLLGPRGAAAVFGPQKGAAPEMVTELEAGLSNLADVIERDLGIDVREIPGAGAAGGLGAGAMAFLGARLVSGVDAVMDAIRLRESLEGADWVITGEGRFDDQSLHGKVVSGVTKLAREAGVRVAVLAGSVALSEQATRDAGIEVVYASSPAGMPLAEAMARGGELLEEAAARLGPSLVAGAEAGA